MIHRIRSAVLLALCVLLYSSTAGWATSHMEKTKILDEYIRDQYRSSPQFKTQEEEASSKEGLRRAIAKGFRHYNGEVSWANALEYAGYVIEACDKYGINDPTLIAGMIVKESRVRPRARSRYAYGLMQIYWKVHRKSIARTFPWIKNTESLMSPRNNILVGTWIFSNYLKSAGGNVEKALHRYLGASSSRYVSKIMSYRGTMRRNLTAVSK
ncbi:transglycosylase SLT domain-containing protein [Dethiosulfovibrio sp. F2B]|uniref:transglycosylase SLT domain-containing protein n=1 Tax=Dethiosulfovibrio faecalis TaxID=2720018 RepID=UPI001F19CDB9|nr:transglycosylase SLT domain-containing protein [Dethiosulfovibrio faecalis]MCF4150608.1 transglycosylase SLT domain-containing protein [Dethiosulfovibrio faecalis]